MCTTVYSASLLLFFIATLAISIMCGTKMVTEGLPLVRQERGADPDILAGADFLSVFMGSTLRRALRETTTTPPPPTTVIDLVDTEPTDSSPYIRTSRSTPEVSQSTEATTDSAQDLVNIPDSSDSSLNDGVIVAVSVSSSVGRTLIHKKNSNKTNPQALEDTAVSESSADIPDQELVASEEHPSIVAEANKSEFNVEEKEPITRISDLETSEFSRSYPASVHALPRPQHIPFNPSADFKDKLTPYHHTIIYHGAPGESGSARSVSYSTVIQSIPQVNTEKTWDDKPKLHERHERNYNGESFANTFEDPEGKKNSTKLYQSESLGNLNYFTTSRPLRNANDNEPKNWENPEVNYEELSTKKSITTERNWELDEKAYNNNRPIPKVYGLPEQNYEVDEAISVVTNGRVHGVQPSQSPESVKVDDPKKDDNQKVGYVVEGRKFRKYRLEERTSDGFIVGEYGVVNHDDGSLRGVRYTADGTISPRLIYDALMKFLSL